MRSGAALRFLPDGAYQSGQQNFSLDAAKLLSGIYFLQVDK